MQEPTKKKIIKKVIKIKKIVRESIEKNEENINQKITDSDFIIKPSEIKKTKEVSLEDLVNEGKSIEDMSKILGKTESKIRFQMKMSRFSNLENDKNTNTNVAKLLDENEQKEINKIATEMKEKELFDKINKQPYNEDKLLKNITILNFIEKIKDNDLFLINLYDRLILESILEIKKNY